MQVWTRTAPSDYGLAVNYRGKPTFHQLAQDESGIFTVNKKRLGDWTSLEQAIQALHGTVQGWPVKLTTPIPAGGGGVVGGGGGGGATSTAVSTPVWLHPKMGKTESQALMEAAGTDEGIFMVCCSRGVLPLACSCAQIGRREAGTHGSRC